MNVDSSRPGTPLGKSTVASTHSSTPGRLGREVHERPARGCRRKVDGFRDTPEPAQPPDPAHQRDDERKDQQAGDPEHQHLGRVAVVACGQDHDAHHGEDEAAAMDAVVSLFERRFDEDN